MEAEVTTAPKTLDIPWQDRDYTVNDVAKIRNVSPRHIWREIAEGRLKVRRYSARIVRIPGSEIVRTQAEAEG
jgi:helix-turn-helix protein